VNVDQLRIGTEGRSGGLADCSQIQRDLWYAERLDAHGNGPHLAFRLRVRGAVDPDVLRRACADLVAAHPDLLSRFAERDGEPVRVRHGVTDLERAIDLGTEDRPAAPFDLENGPLFRFGLTPDDGVLAVFHHLVFDGMSRDIAARDLIRCYEARLAGRRAEIGPVPGYDRYVRHERRILDAPPPHGWRETLAADPVALSDVLADGPGGTAAAPVTVRLEAGRLAGLAKVAQAAGTSRHAALLASFAATLAGYAAATRSPVPAIGVPMSTRPAEFAEAAGVFVNEVPLALAPEPGADFGAFLDDVSRRTRAAFALRAYPVSALRRRAGLAPWRPSVVFGYRRGGLPQRLEMAGHVVEYQAMLPGYRTGAELELQLLDHGTHVEGHVGYDPRRFTANAVRALLGGWYRTIDLVGAEPSRPLRSWGVLDEAQERRVTAMGTGSRVAYEGADTVHGLFAAQAAREPGATAVRDGARAVTYAELDRYATDLAHRLRTAGVEPEDRVLVCVPRSHRLVAALLGTLKAGGCYVPLDPDDPPERRGGMARDSGARVLIAEPGAAPVPGFAGTVVPADVTGEAAHAEAAVTGANLAYAMYTSGSTGAPKAAMITHAALRNRLLWMQDAYRLSTADRVLHKTAIGFDVSGWELWWPLISGATLVMAPPGAHRDSARLVRLVRDEGVTVVHFVPPALRAFLDEPDAESCTDLRLVVCSGEALPPDLVDRFHERLGARLENLYGPTEAAIDVTAAPCRPGMDVVPIGTPIANAVVRVLDPELLRAVPVGVTGEICLSGLPLARGYLGRPDLTAERFVPDPSDPGGGRLYRTGDLGRYRDDGMLEYLGRVDHQVKIRGRRVEPGEIEATLLGHPAIRRAAVLGVDTGRGELELAAYLVADGERPDLDRWLRDRLPAAMVPTAIVWLDALPLTSSGKLDRKALPPPESVTSDYVPPRTAAERAVAAVWAELFGLRRVGASDDFFDLGGHSLLATRTLSRLRESFGVELPMRVVFERPTVAALGAAVDEARGR
jgi:amino acid adenylation domain-containing protein